MLNSIFESWEIDDFDGETMFLSDVVLRDGDRYDFAELNLQTGEVRLVNGRTVQAIVWLSGLLTI